MLRNKTLYIIIKNMIKVSGYHDIKDDEIENLTIFMKEDRELKFVSNIIKEFSDKIDWENLSRYKYLSEYFIREFKDKLAWDYISSCQKLSEDFIREFKGYVKWGEISYHQKLSEEFMDEFKDKLDWKYICMIQNLSEKFIDSHMDFIKFEYLGYNLTSDMVLKYKDKLNMQNLWSHVQLSEDALDELSKNKYNIKDCAYLSKLSEEFIDRHKDELNWNYVSSFQKLSEEFIESHLDYVDWGCISSYQKLSEEFIEKYANKIDWKFIIRNTKIHFSNDFIIKHKDFIDFHIARDCGLIDRELENKLLNIASLF